MLLKTFLGDYTFIPYPNGMKVISLALFILYSFAALCSEEIIKHKYYTLNYNEDHEVANWVSYELDHSRLQGCVKRKNNFRIDPLVTTGSADAADYKGSGFDRGHLVPAGDMKFNAQAMSETFYFSNMTPQPGPFNQGRWSQLEYLIRAWALKYTKIWIVTGPILLPNLPTIGKNNQVSVPEEYYKVILRKEGRNYKGIAFLMHIHVPYRDLASYTTSIDQVEELSGFDFFQFLSKEQEYAEKEIDLKSWDFTAKFDYLPCRTLVEL